MVKLVKGYVAVANKLMASQKIRYIKNGSISAVDRENGVVVFRAAGIGLKSINIDKTMVVSISTGETLEGEYELPEDALLHLKIYQQFTNIDSIAHIYPEWAMIYSYLCQEIPVCYIELLSNFGRIIPCVESLFSSRISNSDNFDLPVAMIHAIESQQAASSGAFLLKYDGILSWDSSPIKAFERGKKIENIARTAWRMQAVSPSEVSLKFPEEVAKSYIEMQISNKDPLNCYPGKRLTLDDERKICLEMLVYFDRVCRDNGIRYSLTGGTLLGAVRHKGFIPWDDDIDVFLTRPEFNKLETVFSDEARFIFVNRHKEPGFNYVFGRLVDTKTLIAESPNTLCAGKGIFLDICVVDGLPKNKLLREIHISYMRFLMRARRATVQDPKTIKYREKGPVVVFLKKF